MHPPTRRENLMRPHFYPQGALQTVEQVFAAYGQTAYLVHGLGGSSFTNELRIGTPKYDKRNDIWAVGDENDYRNKFCMGDVNIGKHHNHHYLFLNREDAEAYLAYAKVNTTWRYER